MQVGEQDEPLAQPPQFGSDGLLDLYEDLDVLPDPVRLVDDDGPGVDIGTVGEARPLSGAAFDQHRVARVHQFLGARGR